MNNSRRHKTKHEFAAELGMSRSTLYRRMFELEWESSGELLSPVEQDELREALNNYKKKKAASERRKKLLALVDTN